jgi:hypothetical protein
MNFYKVFINFIYEEKMNMKGFIEIGVILSALLIGMPTLADFITNTTIHYDDTYNFIILTPAQFTPELQPLVTHKNNRGISTILVTLDDIYNGNIFPVNGRDNPEKIKYFIKDSIEYWDTNFVLLVGGSEQLPSRYTHIYYDDFNLYPTKNEWVFLSDLYYADIYDDNENFASWDTNNNSVFAEFEWYGNTDEMNLYPDIYLGRLACINKSEVTICVNKIIAYEIGEQFKKDWFHNIVGIGGDSLPGDAEKIDEGEYVQKAVFEIMSSFSPTKIWASNEKLRQISNINDAIDSGAGFVFFNGHGNVDLWGTHPHEHESEWLPPGFYRNSDINTLSNENKLPIVISDACYHCKYDTQRECFGWTFMTNPNGGAIAFIGGTDIDLSFGGTDITTKGIEKLCLELSTHYIRGTRSFGELWSKSLTTYISTATMDPIDYITLEQSQPFGDPTLEIASASQPPVQPAVPEGTTVGKANIEYLYTTITIDPEGDRIYYLFDWGDGTDSGWIGPYHSGAEANASHNWAKKGMYDIKVKAKDEHGSQSFWSDPLSVSMPKNRIINIKTVFLQFLKNYPNLFPILRQILLFLE